MQSHTSLAENAAQNALVRHDLRGVAQTSVDANSLTSHLGVQLNMQLPGTTFKKLHRHVLTRSRSLEIMHAMYNGCKAHTVRRRKGKNSLISTDLGTRYADSYTASSFADAIPVCITAETKGNKKLTSELKRVHAPCELLSTCYQVAVVCISFLLQCSRTVLGQPSTLAFVKIQKTKTQKSCKLSITQYAFCLVCKERDASVHSWG